MTEVMYCGFVAIVGRSNVGKSTLLNQLLGQKISITSQKPQTTRYSIMGICTQKQYQVIYIDTPGFYIEGKQEIYHSINSIVSNTINSVELVIFVIEGIQWTLDDEKMVDKLRNISCPIIVVINKIDHVTNKELLLPCMQLLSQKIFYHSIIPICARNGMNIKVLSDVIFKALPKGRHLFPENYITNHSQRFIASEIIREKLMRFLGDELPYCVRVEIKKFNINTYGNYNISGVIVVKRNGQKKIIIGYMGKKIKIISIKARKDMEAIFQVQVNLKLWVKVKMDYDNKEFYSS